MGSKRTQFFCPERFPHERRTRDLKWKTLLDRWRVTVGEDAKMKLAFLSLLSRNGIVDFIRNNKSQHIKISYYKVRRRDRRLSSARSKWDWVGRGGFPAPSTSYISHSTDYSSRHNNKVNIIIGDSVGCYNNRKVVLNFGIIITSIGYNSDLTNSLPIWSLDPRWAQQ